MPFCRLSVPVFATSFLLIGFHGPATAQSTPPADSAQLKEALVGSWVMDQEATADAIALEQFGPKWRVVPDPKKPGQPQTFSTNFINKPFNVQEYAMMRSVCLASMRADTNEVSSRMTFAPDGTGTTSEQNTSGRQAPVEHFKWGLQGSKLTITAPDDKRSIQTEFTNKNQLSLRMWRGIRIVLKPEGSAPKFLTNAPAAK